MTQTNTLVWGPSQGLPKWPLCTLVRFKVRANVYSFWQRQICCFNMIWLTYVITGLPWPCLALCFWLERPNLNAVLYTYRIKNSIKIGPWLTFPIKSTRLNKATAALLWRKSIKSCWNNKFFGTPLLLVEIHLANRHLANRHLANRHLATRHLANRHLANSHLANSHLANSHLAKIAFCLHSYDPVIWPCFKSLFMRHDWT